MTPNRVIPDTPLYAPPHATTRHFHVAVGHWNLQVDATDSRTAVDQARRLLSQQLPRLWDLIHELPPQRFIVTDAAANPHAMRISER